MEKFGHLKVSFFNPLARYFMLTAALLYTLSPLFSAQGDHIRCLLLRNPRGCPRGVMVKVMDCGIVVREFVFQSRYYVHFRANTFGKGMNPLTLPAMG